MSLLKISVTAVHSNLYFFNLDFPQVILHTAENPKKEKKIIFNIQFRKCPEFLLFISKTSKQNGSR